MKGMVFDIRSFSVHDGPGIRLTVFLKGCPLHCWWCHNPESRSPEPEKAKRVLRMGESCFETTETIGRHMKASEIVGRALADKPFFDESGGGITLSGGEPLMQPEFAAEIMALCKQAGIHTALDTSGYAPLKSVEAISPFTDLYLFDMKVMDAQLHLQFTGKTNQIIIENLKWLSKQNKNIHIRLPLIPEITDTAANLKAIKQLLQSLGNIQRLDLLPGHDLGREKLKRLGLKQPAAKAAYNRHKAEEIKLFFNEAVPLVTIGG